MAEGTLTCNFGEVSLARRIAQVDKGFSNLLHTIKKVGGATTNFYLYCVVALIGPATTEREGGGGGGDDDGW